VTGFISWRRNFQILEVPEAPFMPRSWRASLTAGGSGGGDFVVKEPADRAIAKFHDHANAFAISHFVIYDLANIRFFVLLHEFCWNTVTNTGYSDLGADSEGSGSL
jgi:hypothetical protein